MMSGCCESSFNVVKDGTVIETYDHQSGLQDRLEWKFESVDTPVRLPKRKWRVRIHFTDDAYCDIDLTCGSSAHEFVQVLRKTYGGG